jgi:hypothetical protein
LDTFCDLFSYKEVSVEAVNLVKTSKYARKTLEGAIKVGIGSLGRVFNDSDRIRVWFALRGEDYIDEILINERKMLDKINDRVDFIRIIVSNLIEYYGRRWVRNRVIRWWREADFLEEEKEVLLRLLAEEKVLNWGLVEQMGPDAIDTIQRLIRQDRIRPEYIDGFDFEVLRTIRGTQPVDWLSSKIGMLFQPVTLTVDIRDSGLKLDELSRTFSGIGDWKYRDKKLLTRAMKEMREYLHMREYEVVMEALTQYSTNLGRFSGASTEIPSISFPLIRFLHLLLILEAPSLTSALSTPELFLAPEVVMVVLGRDAVTYSPELRVFRDTDRRWRAHWVERAGEALSVLFLESAEDLDLSTLSRIDERSDKPTPDFLAQTNKEERIVIESKGSTSWEKHKKQRKDALIQLGKQTPGKGKKKEDIFSWAQNGRAFAMSLFAAMQGDNRSSLLHVEDPVFGFDEFFSKGWLEEARLNHYVAVLEAAQLFEVADNLRHRHITEVSPGDAHIFTIEGKKEKEKKAEREESSRFVGTFLQVRDAARRFRHPKLKDIDKLRIFVGVDEWTFNQLRQNRLPARRRLKDTGKDEESALPPDIPGWGLLPGRKSDDPPRGVYSLLNDGAFLALEMQ